MLIVTLKEFILIFFTILFGYIIYVVACKISFYVTGMFKWEAYAKLYNPYPTMLLDRKYGIEYKYHWWQSWKYYIKEGESSDNNLTYIEAMQGIYNLKHYGAV